MNHPGTQLRNLCRGAKNQVILVAPFIKVHALEQILYEVPAHVQVDCVTRWRPDEIASGVSDLEVWLFLRERPTTKLWLRSDLHAKFYRADTTCLIGSANLTYAALGWASQSNLELLVGLSSTEGGLIEFEQDLFSGCVTVDDSIYTYVRNSVEQFVASQTLANNNPLPAENIEINEPSKDASKYAWLPTLRHPDSLYKAYLGKLSELTSTSRYAALEDLSALQIPTGLSLNLFRSYVGALLLQKPLIRQVDEFVIDPQRFGAVTEFLKRSRYGKFPELNPDEAWQTLMRWLLYFLPERYSVSTPHHSEIFVRKS